MYLLIEKLKIANFLSFLGEYEVNLKPCTAIICNYYEGKDDLSRAFEFVFGATLSDLRVENPLDLVPKTLKEEFLINPEINTCVEVTLTFPQEMKQLKFSRSVKNGTNNQRIDHKISDLITSSVLYEEKLNSLGIHIRQKNMIFYKSYFNNAIWGTSEDLELTISTCLRENYMFDKWKKANKEVEYLKKLKSHCNIKDYHSMKRSHAVIAKYTKNLETFWKRMETTADDIPKNALNDFSYESIPSLTDSAEKTKGLEDSEKKEITSLELETKIFTLTKNLDHQKLKEVTLTSRLYHEEIKLAAKPVNASVLQNRIILLKLKLLEKENKISEIYEKIQSIQFELENLNRKIPFALISLQDLQIKKFQQNRFTKYGKFNDFLQPSRYVQLLKQIIGPEIFHANLCDSVEDAFVLLQQLQYLKYEHREVFLPFENYSHKLKDVIIASGEKGVQINTLEELLIFLCKLKHFRLIDEVPVIAQRNFIFENVIPDDYSIYIHNNVYFMSKELISLKIDENDFLLESQNEIEKNLLQLYTEEEINYRKWKDLLFFKLETLNDINSLENDVFSLKQKWKKSSQKSFAVKQFSPAMEIYEEYHDIFKQYAEDREKYESEERQEEPISAEDSSASSNEESVNLIIKDLEDVITEKIKTQRELEDLSCQLHLLNILPVYGWKLLGNFTKFQNNLDTARFFFEKEFRKLKKLMTKDDMEDFLGCQEWRIHIINILIKDSNEIKKKLLTSTEKLQNLATARKKKLYQLFDHCSRSLTNTFRQILDEALPFLKLDFGPGEENIHIFSCLGEEKINLVDIKHFNTLIRFISALAIFLEIARFEKIPLVIFDDIEEYFPAHNDNFEAVLDQNTLNKVLPDTENPRFHLLMRLGQFLKLYIKKNTPGKCIRHNGNSADFTSGPTQVIYFAKEDFVLASEHCIWIHNQILPEEYITENCNSYSEMYEINFEDFMNKTDVSLSS